MRSKIYFPEQISETIEEAFSSFIISQTSKGVAAVTIRNYHLYLQLHFDFIASVFCCFCNIGDLAGYCQFRKQKEPKVQLQRTLGSLFIFRGYA